MKKQQLKEGSIVTWNDIKTERPMKGQVIKLYTNAALVDISIMNGYEAFELGDLTVVKQARLAIAN